jgi:protein-S-isoprenylcysteine O-methyltransferase Ste14
VTHPAADTPGVIVRPPRLFLGVLVLGLALDYLWPVPLAPGGLPNALQYVAGGALFVLGAVILAAPMRQFVRAGTNVPTNKPTTALVTGGLYRCSRNPIYIALSLMYGGIGVAADSLWVVALLFLILLVMRYGVIRREERYLERKFGEEYRRYKTSVRRWL